MFEKEIAKTLHYEGVGFTDDPMDSGGATFAGLSLKYLLTVGDRDKDGTLDFDLDKDGDVDPQDVKLLTLDQVRRELVKTWCEPLRLAEINSIRVRWKLMDIGVHCGRRTAVKMLQSALDLAIDGVVDGDVTADGIIGRQTVTAVNTHVISGSREMALLVLLSDRQVKRYVDIVVERPKDLKYLRGWISRGLDRGEGLA